MTATHHRHDALSEPFSKFIENEVTEGRCVSASEVARAGLRLRIDRQDGSASHTGQESQPYE